METPVEFRHYGVLGMVPYIPKAVETLLGRCGKLAWQIEYDSRPWHWDLHYRILSPLQAPSSNGHATWKISLDDTLPPIALSVAVRPRGADDQGEAKAWVQVFVVDGAISYEVRLVNFDRMFSPAMIASELREALGQEIVPIEVPEVRSRRLTETDLDEIINHFGSGAEEVNEKTEEPVPKKSKKFELPKEFKGSLVGFLNYLKGLPGEIDGLLAELAEIADSDGSGKVSFTDANNVLRHRYGLEDHDARATSKILQGLASSGELVRADGGYKVKSAKRSVRPTTVVKATSVARAEGGVPVEASAGSGKQPSTRRRKSGGNGASEDSPVTTARAAIAEIARQAWTEQTSVIQDLRKRAGSPDEEDKLKREIQKIGAEIAEGNFEHIADVTTKQQRLEKLQSDTGRAGARALADKLAQELQVLNASTIGQLVQ